MQHLVELTYPEAIKPIILQAVAYRLKIPAYLVWSKQEAIELYQTLLRRTLFLGLSDGARIDTFRRTNAGVVSNEQVVGTIQVEDEKWDDLLSDLQKEQGASARFEFIVALDDFTASGTSLIRKKGDAWKGKLDKLWKSVSDRLATHFSGSYLLCVHHYVASAYAAAEIPTRDALARSDRPGSWFREVRFTFGTCLPEDVPITRGQNAELTAIIDKYYDRALETRHTEESGVTDVKFGYGGSGLPLVLEHNTPNNSIALLWAETEGEHDQHAMRPLFRRRQRHS
jgi:hypothetical protein